MAEKRSGGASGSRRFPAPQQCSGLLLVVSCICFVLLPPDTTFVLHLWLYLPVPVPVPPLQVEPCLPGQQEVQETLEANVRGVPAGQLLSTIT